MEEDVQNRSLVIKLANDENLNNKVFYIKMSYFSKTKFNFVLGCSPFSSPSDQYKQQTILKKIKDLEYRRVYVQDSDGNNLVTSSCPILTSCVDPELSDFLFLVEQLNAKGNFDLKVPVNITSHLVKELRNILNEWEEMDDQKRERTVAQLKKNDFINPKSTFIQVHLIDDSSKIARTLIYHQPGWLKYSSLGIVPVSVEKKREIDKIIKEQRSILLNVNVRTDEAVDLFNQIQDKADEEGFFKVMFGMLGFEGDELPTIKTNVSVNFLEPVDNIQKIEVVIKEADDDWNKMEEYYIKEDYIQLVPILEKFKRDSETLAYAYVLDHQYANALELCEESLREDIKSVIHFSKGLAYVGLGDYSSAYEAYLLGVNICTVNWHPVARDNLNQFISQNSIQNSSELQKIIDLLDQPRSPLHPNQNCYCGSKKKLKKCHAKIIQPQGK